MVQTTKEFQEHAHKFLVALKTNFLDEKVLFFSLVAKRNVELRFSFLHLQLNGDKQDQFDFHESLRTFVSICQRILGFAMKRLRNNDFLCRFVDFSRSAFAKNRILRPTQTANE